MASKALSDYQEQLASAIVQRKHKPLPALDFQIPLSELMDESFCRSVASELKKGGRSWESRKATPDLWQFLPDRSGLYMFVFTPDLSFSLASRPDEPVSLRYALYVGKAGAGESSGTLKSRYRNDYKRYVAQDPRLLWELEPTNRTTLLRKYLNIYPLEYWFVEVVETEEIGRIETSLIKLLNPPLNTQGKISRGKLQLGPRHDLKRAAF